PGTHRTRCQSLNALFSHARCSGNIRMSSGREQALPFLQRASAYCFTCSTSLLCYFVGCFFRMLKIKLPQQRLRSICGVHFRYTGIDKECAPTSGFAIYVVHRAAKKSIRELPEAEAVLHNLITENRRLSDRSKLHAMHQRIERLNAFSAAFMAQAGKVSQHNHLRALEAFYYQAKHRQQVAAAVIARVQLQLIERGHRIKDALNLNVINAAIHQHPLHRSSIAGKAPDLLKDSWEKARNFSERHVDAVRIAYADLRPGMSQHVHRCAQMTRHDTGGLVFFRQSLAPYNRVTNHQKRTHAGENKSIKSFFTA